MIAGREVAAAPGETTLTLTPARDRGRDGSKGESVVAPCPDRESGWTRRWPRLAWGPGIPLVAIDAQPIPVRLPDDGDYVLASWPPANGTNGAEYLRSLAARFSAVVDFTPEGVLRIRRATDGHRSRDISDQQLRRRRGTARLAGGASVAGRARLRATDNRAGARRARAPAVR